jgi:hypothetical protein
MEKRIKVFKFFEEQEQYFLEYFHLLSPPERLKTLAKLQKKITVQKHFYNEH